MTDASETDSHADDGGVGFAAISGGGGGGGTVQDAAEAAPQTPLEQLNDAEPVAGSALSTAVVLVPELIVGTGAEHVMAPTNQLADFAAQGEGAGGGEL